MSEPIRLWRNPEDGAWTDRACTCGDPPTPHTQEGDDLMEYAAIERAAYAALTARVARLEAALATAYDLVAEAIGTPQYDFRARAKACVEACRDVLLNRAALDEGSAAK